MFSRPRSSVVVLKAILNTSIDGLDVSLAMFHYQLPTQLLALASVQAPRNLALILHKCVSCSVKIYRGIYVTCPPLHPLLFSDLSVQ